MRRLWYALAGIDHELIKDCPGSDKLWAAQLGISLILTFAFVGCLTYYSVGYFIHDTGAKIAIALLVASVLALFDRALFQSDWFTVLPLVEVRRSAPERYTLGSTLLRALGSLVRLSARLTISILLAYTLSLFAEVAIFSDAITERIAQVTDAQNTPYRDRLKEFVVALDREKKALLDRADAIAREINNLEQAKMSTTDADELKRLQDGVAQARKRIQELEPILRDREAELKELNDDIYAEVHGLKLKPHHTGTKGCEPGSRCFGYRDRAAAVSEEIRRIRQEFDAARQLVQGADTLFNRTSNAALARYAQAITDKKTELASVRSTISSHERERGARIATQEDELKRTIQLKPQRDDPIVRISKLNELKKDPDNGAVISEMSNLIKFLIAFLEIAPVVAKIFFYPPTVYSTKLRGAVIAGQSHSLKTTFKQLDSRTIEELAVKSEIDEAEAKLRRQSRTRRIFDRLDKEFWRIRGRRAP